MAYHSLLIKKAGKKHVHYVLNPYKTACGESLENTQFKLEYNLEDKKLCPACEKYEPVPSIKDWTFTKPIKTKKQAFLTLDLLYLFFRMLDREFRICQSLEESDMFGSCDLTLFLTDDEPKIEKIEDGKVEISYSDENKRIKRTVSFERVGMIMKSVKKDLLVQFEIMRN